MKTPRKNPAGKVAPAATCSASTYAISPGYRKAVVWTCDTKTRRRECTTTITPNKELDRRGKHEAICRGLECFSIPLPDYEPLASEKPNVRVLARGESATSNTPKP